MDAPRHSGPVTRERLIEAAGEIFAEKGLAGARVRDITRRAGANVAAVNYHFHDKTELYKVVLLHAHESILGSLDRPLTAATPEARIRELLNALLAASLNPDRPEWQRRLLGRELMEPTTALDELNDVLRRPVRRIQTAVQEMRPDVSEADCMLAASNIIAQCIFYVHHRHVMHRLFPSLGDLRSKR